MCNCVIKCVGFLGFPQFVVILPMKRFASDSRAKSPLPRHKKALAGDSTISLRAALPFDFTRRRQERRFFRPERVAGRSRTRGCGLVQLGLKSQLAPCFFTSSQN